MKIFNFNNEFTEKVNLEKFTLKFNGNCINNEIFKYLSQVNILDDLRRSIFLITNDEIEKYNCFLTAIFFLQKKKAENAKKNIILPPDIRVLYRGIEYNLNSAVIENNHVCLKKGNNAASISLTEFDFLKPYTLPYNSGYQNQLNGLDTFKKYARILLLENINAIFDTNYYEEFKPEEGIVLISNNKKKIRSLFKNSSVVYN